METHIRNRRWPQINAWAVVCLFLAGLFVSSVGAWTGPILGVWFVGTQRVRRGFLWMVAFALLFSLRETWHKFSLTVVAHGVGAIPRFLGLMALAVLLSVLPFTFHRVVGARLPGFLSTLAFPAGAVALTALIRRFGYDGAGGRASIEIFVVSWAATTAVWLWDQESATEFAGPGFAAFIVLVACWKLVPSFNGTVFSQMLPDDGVVTLFCVLGAGAMTVHAGIRPVKKQTWASRLEAISLLRSPESGCSLYVENQDGSENLVSESGERFPIRAGLPDFRQPSDMAGDNGKYNHMYETIGGFYDDTQRVFCALKGFDRDAYFRSYMDCLEVRPGDGVLETSVGTGLNYKYLPAGVHLSGLDLSPEMLAKCRRNLRRWKLQADLYLGNAENLPFVDSSFDVVFHVGGINFFNNRSKAIREMIRVAKPGSLLLIADETEKHVKEVYERQPGSKFKNRRESVTAPVDLVPAEMQEIHLEETRSGEWYVLTFRKPAENGQSAAASMERDAGLVEVRV
ncbi:MAG TPA: methyltransferase domain-containing protein [Acidobacteriaceae bacterium]|nr:methyltransferase domain-containing protein [Acidobacteriaceae bacterium]